MTFPAAIVDGLGGEVPTPNDVLPTAPVKLGEAAVMVAALTVIATVLVVVSGLPMSPLLP